MTDRSLTIVRVKCFLCYEVSDINYGRDGSCDYCGRIFTEEELCNGKVIGGDLSVQEVSELQEKL